MKRATFYCQHVLGIGHLVRSAEIVRSLAERFSVLFVTGGETVEGFTFPSGTALLRLPPLQTDTDFGTLQSCDASLDLEEIKSLRRERLLKAFDAFSPDVLITELYPFGRKQFSFELIPLLERAQSGPKRTLVVSSVRDILVTKPDQAKQEHRITELINKYYDLILVHGDERLQRLDETFSRVADFRCPVHYTGYVVQRGSGEAEAELIGKGQRTIVVSNGGGRCLSGHLLLESVIRAAYVLRNLIPHVFVVFAGPSIPQDVYERLQQIADPTHNVVLTKYTPNIAAYLKRAELSISMGGYNTVMDILRSRVRSLVYPVTANGDQEQAIRSEKLARLGLLTVLDTEALEPSVLSAEIMTALERTPGSLKLNLAGADESARFLHSFIESRSAETRFLKTKCQ